MMSSSIIGIKSGIMNSQRITNLDGIRGIAIILVMLLHYRNYGEGFPAVTFLDRQVERLVLSGWMGVDLFFVLSGFLITGILSDSKNNSGYFRKFYMRRFLRIFPLYYGFLFALLLVLPLIDAEGAEFQLQFREQIWYWTYLINWKVGLGDWPQYFGIAHFWSLAIEEQFYVVWPAVVYFSSPKRLVLICLLIVIASPIFRLIMADKGFDLAYVLTFSRMDALAIGGLIAIMTLSSKGLELLKRIMWPALIITFLLLGSLFIWKKSLAMEDYHTFTLGLSVIAVFFGALISFAILMPSHRGLGRIFSSKPLRFFGKYSYALYVFHHLVAIYLPKFGFSIKSIPTLGGSDLPGFLIFSLVATVLSSLLALASWHLWEVHFLKFKKHFEYERSQRRLEHLPAEIQTN
jgi:peptidoglycan/LPS O-acetylase OafA/YrhL